MGEVHYSGRVEHTNTRGRNCCKIRKTADKFHKFWVSFSGCLKFICCVRFFDTTSMYYVCRERVIRMQEELRRISLSRILGICTLCTYSIFVHLSIKMDLCWISNTYLNQYSFTSSPKCLVQLYVPYSPYISSIL